MKTSSTSSSDAATRKRPPVPWVLLAAVALVLAFEGFQQLADLYFYVPTGVARFFEGRQEYGSTPLRMRLKSRTAYTGEAPAEVAIFGDSTAYIGLMPDVIEARTAMTAYNYGTLRREGILSSRLLLANLMRHEDGGPKVIVLAFSPFALAAGELPTTGLAYTYSHGNTRLLIEEFGFSGWLESRIPSLRHQALLREIVEGRPWPGPNDFAAIDRAVESARRNRGRLPHHEDVVYRDRGDLARWITDLETDAPIDAEQDRHLAAILRMARENDIAVLAFVTPIVPDALDLYTHQPRWPTIDRYLESKRARLGSIEILQLQDAFMDSRQFSDVMHLNRKGALRLSVVVADAIAQMQRTR